jgi:O-antigen/teichoic acid export membrane protein
MKQHRAGAWLGILQNTGWMLGGKIVGALLSLVYLGLATRYLGPVAFGQFVLILGTGQMIATAVGFETWRLLLRYGMRELHEGRHEQLGRLFTLCVVLDFAGSLAGAVCSMLAIWILAPRFDWSPAVQRDALLFCCVMLLSVRSAAVGLMRLYDRFAAATIAETMVPIVRLLGGVTVFFLRPSVEGLLAAWAAAEVVAATAHWMIAINLLPPKRRWWSKSSLSGVPRTYPGFWHYAAITNGGSTLGLVSRQFAVLLVGAGVGPAAAGAYRIAHQLGQAIATISDMLSRSIFAELLRARAGYDPAHMTSLFRKAVLIAVIAAAAVLLMLVGLSRPAISLLAGPRYADVYPLVILLGAAAAIEGVSGAFESALLAAGLMWRAFWLRFACTGLLMIALISLLHFWGTIGAASAALLASVVTSLLMGKAAWRAIHASNP